MTTKERIYSELETLSEDELQQLLTVIQSLAQANPPSEEGRKPGLLSKLKQVQIDAPEDFASNLYRYLAVV